MATLGNRTLSNIRLHLFGPNTLSVVPLATVILMSPFNPLSIECVITMPSLTLLISSIPSVGKGTLLLLNVLLILLVIDGVRTANAKAEFPFRLSAIATLLFTPPVR